MTTTLRLLVAIVLGIAVAFAWRVWVVREARLAGHVPADAIDAAGEPAPAETPVPAKLHRCIDAAGAASIQSRPCPAGSRTAWVRDVVAEPGTGPTTVIDTTTPSTDVEHERPGAQPVSFACEMALANRKAYRAGELGAVDDDGLALHEDTVTRACG